MGADGPPGIRVQEQDTFVKAIGSGLGLFAVFALKGAKSLKLLGFVGSLVLYCITMGPLVGAVFLVGLVIHEWGHVVAMKRVGIPTRGFYLIPFVGGVAFANRPFAHPGEEAFVAAAGPVFGLLSLPLCWVLAYGASGGHVEAASTATQIVAFLNLFNLLPIAPLDGGRILRSVVSCISPRATWVFSILSVIGALVLSWVLSSPILAGIGFLVALEAWSERHTVSDNGLSPRSALFWLAVWGVLVVGFVTAMVLSTNLGGHPELMNELREF